MKRKLYLLLGLLVALQMPLLTSCNDDDEDIMPTQVPAEVTAALAERYPSATPKWEKGKGLYKAEFYNESGEVDVWFKANGEWVMTQTDIFPQNLPEAVKKHLIFLRIIRIQHYLNYQFHIVAQKVLSDLQIISLKIYLHVQMHPKVLLLMIVT